MPLQINLLHEAISAERERKRDPLKLGLIGLGAFGALLFLYYGWNAYQTLEIKNQLDVASSEWQKVEPKVTAAQKRATELGQIIDSTKVLDGLIDQRFYWAPFLAQISHCVSPNIQVTSLDSSIVEADHSISATLEGLAAAHEPRAAAEDFRKSLLAEFEKNYSGVKVTFRNLEDLDTLVSLNGAPNPSSRFVISIAFNPAQGKAVEVSKPLAKNK